MKKLGSIVLSALITADFAQSTEEGEEDAETKAIYEKLFQKIYAERRLEIYRLVDQIVETEENEENTPVIKK